MHNDQPNPNDSRHFDGKGAGLVINLKKGVDGAYASMTYRQEMAMAKVTTMRLTPEDIAILDAVQRNEGLMARSEALRHVLRYYAQAKGIELAKPKPSRKTKR